MSYNRDPQYSLPLPGQGGPPPSLPPRPGPPASWQRTPSDYDPHYNTTHGPQSQAFLPQTSHNAPPGTTYHLPPPVPARIPNAPNWSPHNAPQQSSSLGGYQINPSNQHASMSQPNTSNYGQGYQGYSVPEVVGTQPAQSPYQAPQGLNTYAIPTPPVAPNSQYTLPPPPITSPPAYQSYSYPHANQQYGRQDAATLAPDHNQGSHHVYSATSTILGSPQGLISQSISQSHMAPPQVIYGPQPGYNGPNSASFTSPEPATSSPAMLPTPARPPHTNVDDVSSMLNELNIQGSLPHREAPAVYDDFGPEEWTRPVPTISEDGVSNEILFECPESRELDYETSWYCLPDTTGILICTRCHDMYIARSSLSKYFERITRPTGKCSFNVPRLTRLLLPEARRTGDLRPVKDHMIKRQGIPNCKEQQGATGHEGIKWFGLAKNEIDGFVSCEACYEDVVLGTPFSKHFVAHDYVQLPDQTWSCDVCIPFIRRAFLKFSRRPDGWNSLVTVAAKRLSLPACEGKAVAESSVEWVQPRRKIHDLVFCETCYLDKVALTGLEHDFEYVVQQKPSNVSSLAGLILGQEATQTTLWVCDAPKIPILTALDAGISRKDFNVFYRAADITMSSPDCTAQGISDGTWYTLSGGCNGFNICAACYAGFFETWGLERFFQKVKMGGSQPVLCSYNPAHPRFTQYVYRQAEAMEVGVWTRFSNFVRKWASIPQCPRENLVENRRWYGYGDCVVCPECYHSFCVNTDSVTGTLEVPLKNELVANSRMCCMYSPRMRTKWKEACAEGSPTDLIEFSRMRMEVYAQTVLQIKMMRTMQDIQRRQALHAGTLSVMYQGMEGTRILSGTTDGHLHGSSSLGWHYTQEGATSAALLNQMQTGLRQSSSPNTAMTIMQLRRQWAEVE